jgi:hypothetical protein
MYAFDVHCNGFFVSFLITYVLQVRGALYHVCDLSRCALAKYFFLPILLTKGILACMLSNAVYGGAFLWYAYITHLGYRGTHFIYVHTQYPHNHAVVPSATISFHDPSLPVVPNHSGLRLVAARDRVAALESHPLGHGLSLRLACPLRLRVRAV